MFISYFPQKHIHVHTHATHIEPCKAFERALFLCIIYIILSQCCSNALHSLSSGFPPLYLSLSTSLPPSLHLSGSLIYFDSLCVLSDNVQLTCTPIHIFPFTPCTEEHMFDESIHLFTQKRINCYTLFHEFDEDRRFKWCGLLQQTHGQTMIWILVNRKHRTTYESFTVCSSTKISHSHAHWYHCI